MIVPAKKGPPLTLLFDTVTLNVVLLGTSASIATVKRSAALRGSSRPSGGADSRPGSSRLQRDPFVTIGGRDRRCWKNQNQR